MVSAKQREGTRLPARDTAAGSLGAFFPVRAGARNAKDGRLPRHGGSHRTSVLAGLQLARSWGPSGRVPGCGVRRDTSDYFVSIYVDKTVTCRRGRSRHACVGEGRRPPSRGATSAGASRHRRCTSGCAASRTVTRFPSTLKAPCRAPTRQDGRCMELLSPSGGFTIGPPRMPARGVIAVPATATDTNTARG